MFAAHMSLFDRSLAIARANSLQFFATDGQRWAIVVATFVISSLVFWFFGNALFNRRRIDEN